VPSQAIAASANKKVKRKVSVRGTVDVTFLILVLLIVTVGLVMLFSASYADAYYRIGNSYHYISKQLVSAVLGVFAMIFVSFIDYRILHKLALPALIISIALTAVTLVMPPLNNARRWIFLGSFTFQPSEIVKFTLALFLAHYISLNYNRMKEFKVGVLVPMAVLGVIALILLKQPHLSCTIIILLIGLTMMFVGGTSLKWFAVGGGLIGTALVVMVLFTDFVSYAYDRIHYWIDPESDPLGAGFQTLQSLTAIGSGGLLGLGLGNSRQKYLYLPEPHNDFIFSVICEELGFVGATLVIILFVLLVWRGFVIAMRATDKFGALLAIGLILQVGYQTLLNIAVVTNTIPNTGISLPFFSYGGTALAMLLAQMGVILSISRFTNMEKK